MAGDTKKPRIMQRCMKISHCFVYEGTDFIRINTNKVTYRIHTDFRNDKYLQIFGLADLATLDYQGMWSKFFNKLEFLAIMKSSNGILEMDDKYLFSKGLNLLYSPEELKKVTMKKLEAELEITMLKSYGFPVKLTVHAKKCSEELFYQKVTYPLLLSVQDLKASQQELCTLLVKKDDEINEYKEEGGQIALRHLKTPKFDEEKHISSHAQFSKHFAFTELPEFITHRAKEVPIMKENPEVVVKSIKTEPPQPHTSQNLVKDEPVPTQPHTSQNLVKDEPVPTQPHASQNLVKDEPVPTQPHASQNLVKDEPVPSQPHASQNQVKEEPASQADIKQEILSQSSQVNRKRPRKLNNL